MTGDDKNKLSQNISTILALKLGLQETNAVLLSTSSLIGLGLVDALLIVKVLVMLGAGMPVLVGVRSSSHEIQPRL